MMSRGRVLTPGEAQGAVPLPRRHLPERGLPFGQVAAQRRWSTCQRRSDASAG